jgi:hypothetical protein
MKTKEAIIKDSVDRLILAYSTTGNLYVDMGNVVRYVWRVADRAGYMRGLRDEQDMTQDEKDQPRRDFEKVCL